MRWRGRTVAAVVGAAVLALAAGCGLGSGSEDRAGRLQRPARGPGRGHGRRASPRRPASRSRCATASDFELGQPDRPGGRRVAGRRLPHRELAGHDAGRRTRACSPRWTRPRWRRCRPQYRPSNGRLGRRRGPLDGAGLQHRRQLPSDELPASIMDLADPEWKGQVGIAAGRRRLPGDRQRRARAQGRGRGRGLAEGPEGQRARSTAATAPIMKAVNAGEIPAGDHLPLLLVQGPGRVRRQQQQRRAALLRQPGPRRVLSASPAPAC